MILIFNFRQQTEKLERIEFAKLLQEFKNIFLNETAITIRKKIYMLEDFISFYKFYYLHYDFNYLQL